VRQNFSQWECHIFLATNDAYLSMYECKVGHSGHKGITLRLFFAFQIADLQHSVISPTSFRLEYKRGSTAPASMFQRQVINRFIWPRSGDLPVYLTKVRWFISLSVQDLWYTGLLSRIWWSAGLFDQGQMKYLVYYQGSGNQPVYMTKVRWYTGLLSIIW
jgi:hypothetical protein